MYFYIVNKLYRKFKHNVKVMSHGTGHCEPGLIRDAPLDIQGAMEYLEKNCHTGQRGKKVLSQPTRNKKKK